MWVKPELSIFITATGTPIVKISSMEHPIYDHKNKPYPYLHENSQKLYNLIEHFHLR